MPCAVRLVGVDKFLDVDATAIGEESWGVGFVALGEDVSDAETEYQNDY